MIPIIKKSDYQVVKSLIENLHPGQRTIEVGKLQAELRRAKVVEDKKIKPQTIQLNSYFEVRESLTGKVLCFILTLPSQANLAEKKVSILSPLGVALIGFQEGKEFEWELPAGRRKFRIEKVAPSVVDKV